jgi:hypothetical protein
MNTSHRTHFTVDNGNALLNGVESFFRAIVTLDSRVVVPNNTAQRLARFWVNAWNSRDLEGLAEMYADQCEIISPLVAIVMGEPSARLFGKKRLLDFWKRLCEREESVECELFNVYRGVRTLAINYRSFLGKNALELMELDESVRIIRSISNFDQMG